MNFTHELSQFQGALISADYSHKFSELSAKGGNEDKISDVIKSLSRFLVNGGYIDNGKTTQEKTPSVRLFSFYIILNSQLPVLNEMGELEGIDSIINTIQTIPQCLMCELMWNLHMDQFIQEIISFSHPQLALEVSSAFLDNLKYSYPQECLHRLRLLSVACYTNITRLYLLNEADAITSKAQAASHNFKKCLKYFSSPPNEYKLNALDKDELYEYFGNRLHSMLLLILDCVNSFTGHLEMNIPGSNVYLFTYKEGTLKTDIGVTKVCDIENKALSECLSSCLIEILDECKALVMDVSVDVFCGWSEVELSGRTMQHTVGELCYKVHNNLLKISTISDHPLLAMMEQISRKPEEMKDIINNTDDNIILQKISSQNEDRKIWIQSLLHKERVCHNLNFLKAIHSNLNLFDHEQSHILYTMFNKYANEKSENHDYVESIMIKVFHQCSLHTKYMIIDKHFINNNFVNMKQMSDINDSMTETFNKLVATLDSDLSDVLTLFLQNPQEVYIKIFAMATENMQQVEVMLKVMKMLKKYSNYYYNSEMEPCIIKITQDVIHNQLNTPAKENNFVQFVCGLKEDDIIPGSKLLLLIIMTNLHQAMITKSIESINFHVKLLNEVYRLDELLIYRAPLLALLGQVMDVVRWKMNIFCACSPIALNATIELQRKLFETFGSTEIPERESDWLKSKVVHLQPLNMYYYRVLWQPPGDSYLDAVSGCIGNNMSKDELSSWLSQVISSCTQEEWCNIWDSLDKDGGAKLEMFLTAIGMITKAERSNRTVHTAACLLYCYRNFVYIIRYKYLKEPLTDGQVCNVINHIATIVELVKDDLKEEFTTFLVPLFAYLREKQIDYNINYLEYMNQHMKGAALTTIVNNKFCNGTA